MTIGNIIFYLFEFIVLCFSGFGMIYYFVNDLSLFALFGFAIAFFQTISVIAAGNIMSEEVNKMKKSE